MRVCFFKMKYLLVAVLLIAVMSAGKEAVNVFMSGGRNIPVYSVETDDNKVALTFNCAWNADDIDEILKLLEKYNAKCTFFIVGQWAEKYPDKVEKIYKSGHEIGEHSYNHKDYTKLSGAEITNDIKKTADVLKEITGEWPGLVRVPSGAYNNTAVSVIEKNGYTPVQWSVDSIDYDKNSGCEDIFRRATSKTHAGDIILMHNGTENTAVALPRILDSLCGRFELVTVSELIPDGNFVVDNAGEVKRVE